MLLKCPFFHSQLCASAFCIVEVFFCSLSIAHSVKSPILHSALLSIWWRCLFTLSAIHMPPMHPKCIYVTFLHFAVFVHTQLLTEYLKTSGLCITSFLQFELPSYAEVSVCTLNCALQVQFVSPGFAVIFTYFVFFLQVHKLVHSTSLD